MTCITHQCSVDLELNTCIWDATGKYDFYIDGDNLEELKKEISNGKIVITNELIP